MRFVQIEKSIDYIFSHMDEDLHLIKCIRTPEKTSYDGRTLSGYTSFRAKTLKKMSIEEIEEAILDDNTVLIKIELD